MGWRRGMAILAADLAAVRQEVFGYNPKTGGPQMAVPVTRASPTTAFAPAGEPFECYASPVRARLQSDELGFLETHDTVVRFNRSIGFVPILGHSLRLVAFNANGTDLIVRMDELSPNTFNPEWVVGCANVNTAA